MVENFEREMIVDALKKNRGQQRKAAQQLGLTERMMGYKIKKYNIYPKQIV
ncbi:helix-turn-helix domain-containing protein [Sedimentisphaera cyanobacteriorum]